MEILFFVSHTIGQNDLLRPSPTPHSKLSRLFPLHFPNCPSSSTIQSHATNISLYSLFPKSKSSLLAKRVFFSFDAVSATAIPVLVPSAHLASFVIKILKHLKYSTFTT
jgi:hypothetical protein